MRWITIIAVALFATRSAHAHVVASPNENNRYLKVTPMGDRFRLVYTIYFGETPGAGLRRELDTNHDNTVDDDEADAFGQRLAKEVRPALDLTLDGAPVAFGWSDVDVGMGTPEVQAGSFAVDLVGVVCLPTRGAHELVIRDTYPLPIPGETELKVETGLGIEVERITLAGAVVNGDDVKLRGVGGPLAAGWAIKISVGDAAPVGGDTCAAASAGPAAKGARRRRTKWLAIGAAAVIAVAGGMGAALVVKRRKRPR